MLDRVSAHYGDFSQKRFFGVTMTKTCHLSLYFSSYYFWGGGIQYVLYVLTVLQL
jgi:hypothetical protein